MKKALTFLIIFSLMFYPQKDSNAQKESDSTVTKKDIQILNKKDSAVTVKISKQIETIKQNVSDIKNKKPEIRYRTRHIRSKPRVDSFFDVVYIDTCLARQNINQTTIPDTVWMERNKPRLKEFLKGIFGHKPERKDEIKIIPQKDEK